MANTLTTDRDAAGTVAYNLEMARNYRSEAVFSSPKISKKKPSKQTHRGSSVRFWFTSDLAAATTPLSENSDVTPQSIGDSYVDVAIAEYGATVGYTNAVLGTDMLEVNMDAARTASNQAVDTLETLARTALEGGTNVKYGGNATSTATIDATDLYTGSLVRETVAALRTASVPTLEGGMYLGLIHPEVSIDLREETGDAAWLTARNYQAITGINTGMIGSFAGVMFHETPRVQVDADAGATNVDAYYNFILGPEALACAWASKVSGETPQIVVAPQVDNLRRFHAIGWKWFGGFDSYRQESCYRIETASSIGDNT